MTESPQLETPETPEKKLVDILHHKPQESSIPELSKREKEYLALLRKGWYPMAVVAGMYVQDSQFNQRLQAIEEQSRPLEGQQTDGKKRRSKAQKGDNLLERIFTFIRGTRRNGGVQAVSSGNEDIQGESDNQSRMALSRLTGRIPSRIESLSLSLLSSIQELAYESAQAGKEGQDYTTIVERQSMYEQQIVELVANGIDAMSEEKKIGKFGIGAFSAFPRESGDRVRIVSSTGLGVEIMKNRQEYFFRYIPDNEGVVASKQGTRVEVEINNFSQKRDAFLKELEERFSFSEYPIEVVVKRNDSQPNVIYLGRSSEQDTRSPVRVTLTEKGYMVGDVGKGLDEETFLEKFIHPMVSGTRRERQKGGEGGRWGVRREAVQGGEAAVLVIQSGDITITKVPLSSRQKEHMIIQLPSDAVLDVSRREVRADRGLFTSIERWVEEIDNDDDLLAASYLTSYLYRNLKADTQEYTIAERIFSQIAEKLSANHTALLPDYPGVEYFGVYGKNGTRIVPVEVFEKKPIGEGWRGNGVIEWRSSHPLYLTELSGRVMVEIGGMIYIDAEMFRDLLSRGEKGRALLNLLVNPVDTDYESMATLHGEMRKTIGKFQRKEQKTFPSQTGQEGGEPEMPQGEAGANSEFRYTKDELEEIRNFVQTQNLWKIPDSVRKLLSDPNLSQILGTEKLSLASYLDRMLPENGSPVEDWYWAFEWLFSNPNLLEILEDQKVSLASYLDRILPEDGALLEDWYFAFQGLFSNSNLSEVLREQRISLPSYLDRILPQDGVLLEDWYFAFQGLFSNSNLSEVLREQRISLPSYLDRILPQDGAPLEGWYSAFQGLFSNSNLSEVLREQRISLPSYLDRMLPENGSPVERWYPAFRELLSNPKLLEILEDQKVSLASYLDRILPQEGEPLEGWYFAFLRLFQNPNLSKILDANGLSTYLDRMLPENGSPVQSWHVAFLGLFSNPNLLEIFQQENLSLASYLDRMLPEEGQPVQGWHLAFECLLSNPNLLEIFQAIPFGEYLVRVASRKDDRDLFLLDQISLSIQSISQCRDFGLTPWQASYVERVFAEDKTKFSIQLPFWCDDEDLQLHLGWRVKRGEDDKGGEIASVEDIYKGWIDRIDEEGRYPTIKSIKNQLQRVYAYELLAWYQAEGREVTEDAIRLFVETPHARDVIRELLSCNLSDQTKRILDLLTSTNIQKINDVTKIWGGDTNVSLSDLYTQRQSVRRGDDTEGFLRASQREGFPSTRREELQTALTGQTPRADTWIRELVQNATDTAVAEGSPKILLETGVDTEGRAVLCIEDVGRGMSMEDIFTKFLIPLKPDEEKRRNPLVEGGIGWGIFTVFSVADEVEVVTRINGKETHCRLKVIRGEGNEILDVVITGYSNVQTDHPNGTRIQVHLPKIGLPQMDLIQMEAGIQLYCIPLLERKTKDNEPIQITLNNEQLKRPWKKTLGTTNIGKYGDLRVSITKAHEDGYARVQKRKLYLGDPDEMGLLSFVPKGVKSFYEQHGYRIQIDLPEKLQATLSRVGVAIDRGLEARLRHEIAKIVLKDIAKRVVTGEKYLSLVPDDFLYRDPAEYGQFIEESTRQLVESQDALLSPDGYERFNEFQTLIWVIDQIPITFTEEELKNAKDTFVQTLSPNTSYTVGQIRQMILEKSQQDDKQGSFIVGIAKGFQSHVEKTNQAIQAGTAMLEIGQNEKNLGRVVEQMNRLGKMLFGERFPLHIGIANPETTNSTVWMGGRMGMPFGNEWIDKVRKTPIEEWDEAMWYRFYNLLIHELTHWVEDSIYYGRNLPHLQPLFQLLANRNGSISFEEAKKIVQSSGESRPWTHTSSEEGGFGKIYKGLLHLLVRKMGSNVVYVGSS